MIKGNKVSKRNIKPRKEVRSSLLSKDLPKLSGADQARGTGRVSMVFIGLNSHSFPNTKKKSFFLPLCELRRLEIRIGAFTHLGI